MRIIGIGMNGYSNYTGKILNRSIQEVKSKGKNPIQFLQFIYTNKGYITSNWVDHSKLKQLDINDLFERKQIIEDMEAELNGALEKLQILKIWRWMKRQMFMKPSLQNPRLAAIWTLILNKN